MSMNDAQRLGGGARQDTRREEYMMKKFAIQNEYKAWRRAAQIQIEKLTAWISTSQSIRSVTHFRDMPTGFTPAETETEKR
jgi:hypothetical protein